MADSTPLRDVVTRFRFDVDESGVRRFNSSMGSMRGGLRQLAGLFGVTLGIGGAAAVGKMGNSAERAEFQLRRLAGSDFSKFRNVLREVQHELDSIRGGASAIIRPKQFDEAAAGFTRVFGSGKPQMEAFQRIFSFAAKQAVLTGREVTEITKAIQDAVATGGFEELLDLPGFSQFRKQLLEFQQQAMDPGEPGGQVAMANRMRAVTRIIGESTAQQNKDLKLVPEQLLRADAAGNKMQETLEKLGDTLMKSLVPALEKLTKLLDYVIDRFVDVDKKAKNAGMTPAQFFAHDTGSKIARGLRSLSPSRLEKDSENLISRIVREGGNPRKGEIVPPMILEEARKRMASAEMSQVMQTMSPAITNNFYIQNSDPMAVAREVQRRQDQSLQESRVNSPPTERR